MFVWAIGFSSNFSLLPPGNVSSVNGLEIGLCVVAKLVWSEEIGMISVVSKRFRGELRNVIADLIGVRVSRIFSGDQRIDALRRPV